MAGKPNNELMNASRGMALQHQKHVERLNELNHVLAYGCEFMTSDELYELMIKMVDEQHELFLAIMESRDQMFNRFIQPELERAAELSGL